MELLNSHDERTLTQDYPEWINESLGDHGKERERKWTETIAVGCRSFVERVKEKLGVRAVGRNVQNGQGSLVLREPESLYGSGYKNNSVNSEQYCLQYDNMLFWNMASDREQ